MTKKAKISLILILGALILLGTIRILASILVPVTIVRVRGDIKFSDEYKPDAYMCLPAAYTTTDGKVEGVYRVNGITKGTKSLKEFISLHPTRGILIGNQWYSKNGFQQHILVKHHKARHFKDTRKRCRRALCHEGENSTSYLIIESTYPMTLSDFAREVSKYCYNAVNLDMGNYGYGWIGKKKHSRWAKYNQGKQTSWIVCEKQ